MKVKDILDMDIGLLLVIIVLIIIFAKILSVLSSVIATKSTPLASNENVKVLKKKTGSIGYSVTYFATFEFTNGEQKEFIIRDYAAYEALAQGQIGTLTCQGDFYISFVENEN